MSFVNVVDSVVMGMDVSPLIRLIVKQRSLSLHLMHFTASSVIRTTPERLFAFHELPDAFVRLLPPGEKIRVIQLPPSLDVGTRTIVEIRIAFVWVTFESLHTAYDPPHSFEDRQVRGPFASWRHRHIAAPHPDGAMLTDDIE